MMSCLKRGHKYLCMYELKVEHEYLNIPEYLYCMIVYNATELINIVSKRFIKCTPEWRSFDLFTTKKQDLTIVPLFKFPFYM